MIQYNYVTIDYSDAGASPMMNPMRRICLRHCLGFLYAFLGLLAIMVGVFYALSGLLTPMGIIYPVIGVMLLFIAWAFVRRRKIAE